MELKNLFHLAPKGTLHAHSAERAIFMLKEPKSTLHIIFMLKAAEEHSSCHLHVKAWKADQIVKMQIPLSRLSPLRISNHRNHGAHFRLERCSQFYQQRGESGEATAFNSSQF